MQIDAGRNAAVALRVLTTSAAKSPEGAKGGSASGDPEDLITLSKEAQRLVLRLQDGTMSGSASGSPGVIVENTSDFVGDGVEGRRITTGGGSDSVDLTVAGNIKADIQITTNDGDDEVRLASEGGMIRHTIRTGAGDDHVQVGSAGGGYIGTGEGDDTISVVNNASLINAGAGDDTIHLTFNADAPLAQRSDSLARGADGSGNESARAMKTSTSGVATVWFGRGSGHDTIATSISGDSKAPPANLWMGDFSRDDVTLTRSGNDLVFSVKSSDDTLVLQDFDAAAWGQVQFGAEVWTMDDLIDDSGLAPAAA
jgi:hypothetical protein